MKLFRDFFKSFGGAIGGGGRYDKMIEKLIGINVPAVGFGMGYEPVNIVLKESGKLVKDRLKVALIYNKEDDYAKVLKRKKQLMEKYSVATYLRAKNMKAMLDKLKFGNFDAFINLNDSDIKMI